MKLAVTGSRHWTDRAAIWSALSEIRPRPRVLIHGGATNGADAFAAEWADRNGIVQAVVRPVRKDVRQDYIDRNTVIVDLADAVIAFRAAGKSNGTDDTIRKALVAGKLLRAVEE